jgi:transforming growth factor-beta-induced protein
VSSFLSLSSVVLSLDLARCTADCFGVMMGVLRKCATLALLACGTVVRAQAPSLIDALNAYGNATNITNLLQNEYPDFLKLLDSATDADPITFLAPSDIAFGRIPYTDILGQAFQDNNTVEINDILTYHVLPGELTSQSINGSFSFPPTLLTSKNWTTVTGGQRIGAVLQGNNPPLVVFVSGEGTRSVVNEKGQDIKFAGG